MKKPLSSLAQSLLETTQRETKKSLDFETKHGEHLTRKTRRWETLEWLWFLRNSKECQATRKEGADKAGWFPSWQRELHSRLYTGDRVPQLKEMPAEGRLAERLHDALSQLPEWQSVVKRTPNDSYASGVVTNGLSKKLIPQVPQHNSDLEELHRLLAMLEEDEKDGRLQDHSELEKARNDVKQAEKQLEALADSLDDSAIRTACRSALQEATTELDEVDKTARAFGWGTGAGKPSPSQAALKMEAAKRLSNNDKLKKLIELAGRMKNIMRATQESKVRHGVNEVTDIESGGDISRLLTSEIAKLTHPHRKLLLWRDIIERSSLQYKLEAKEKVGKGPIVVCVDDSGSMSGDREVWAKSIALALLELATKEKRDFAYCTFDTVLQATIKSSPSKKANPIALIDALLAHAGGGTNFDNPLHWALNQVAEGDLPDADIIFISDGCCTLYDRDTMMARKKKLGCRIFGIDIGSGDLYSSLASFCDTVNTVSDLAIRNKDDEEKKALGTIFGI